VGFAFMAKLGGVVFIFSPSVFLLRKNPAPSTEGAKGLLNKVFLKFKD
jgi:hypothetical protein